jgi:hypothetical protein
VNQRPLGPIGAPNPTPALPFPVGVQNAPEPARAKSSGWIVALGLVGALVVGVGTFLVASNRRHHANAATTPSDAALTPPSTATSSAAIPADAPTTPPTAASATSSGPPPIPQPAAPVDAGASISIDAAAIAPSHSHGHSAPSNSAVHRDGNVPATKGSASTPSIGKHFDPDAVED